MTLKYNSFKELSIPFWSDFNGTYNYVYALKNDNFQSHFGLISTVALKTAGRSDEEIITFNPILVWFQPDNQLFLLLLDCKHFQSHFGLISTEGFAYEIDLEKASFNPILVWFQLPVNQPVGEDIALSIPFWSDFNYIVAFPYFVFTLTFQSHFGLISTKAIRLYFINYHIAFNPILVWFQHPERSNTVLIKPNLSIPFWSDFNLILSSLLLLYIVF